MRTIEVNICTIHDLKGKAKENARDWWRDLERQYPAWANEHFGSLVRLCVLLKEIPYGEVFFADHMRELIRQCKACELTGYCADPTAVPVLEKAIADGWDKYNQSDVMERCKKAYDREWSKEMTSRMQGKYVDEQIDANEYEFYEDGSFYGG